MGLLDYYVISPNPYVSEEGANQALMIGEEVTRSIESSLARQSKEQSVTVDVGLDGLTSTIQNSLSGIIDAIDHNTGQVTVRLDRLGEGIEALHADFNWMMGDVIWKLELQNQTLNSILRVLQAPLDTQAKELRDRAGFAYTNGWYEEATNDFLEAEKKNYQDFAVHRSLGNIFLYHRQDLPRALSYFRNAAKYAAPRDAKQAAEAHLFAAHVCYELSSHIQEAIIECKRALQLNPDLLQASYDLAKYLANAGNGAAATPKLEAAIRGDARYYEQAELDSDLKSAPGIQATLAKLVTEAQQEVPRLKQEVTHWLDEFVLPDELTDDLQQSVEELSKAASESRTVAAVARAHACLRSIDEKCERFVESALLENKAAASDSYKQNPFSY